MHVIKIEIMAKLVCDLPADFNPISSTVLVSNSDGTMIKVPSFQVGDIKLKKTALDKKREKTAYRQAYMKRPHVQAKVRARLNDPTNIAKRKAYAQREDVKLRKKELAARARLVRRELKQNHPDLYQQLVESTFVH